MKFIPCNWLVLLILEDESDKDVEMELDDCGLYISPDRLDMENGILKWTVGGYSEKQVMALMDKIEKQLIMIGGLKYDFHLE